jgi:YihY family inner membrane protein
MTEQTETKKRMNPFERTARWLDRLQQRHRSFAFPFAVIKKYGDDDAGHQAALITYYGFLSLFPLLLVATSVVDILAQNNPNIQTQLNQLVADYFPIVGDSLQKSIHSSTRSGVALAIGLLFTIYGARGVADAVRNLLDHAWAIPRAKRSGFPLNAIKSFSLLLGAGLGILAAATLASVATSALGHAWYWRAIPLSINAVLLYIIFMFVFLIGTSRRFKRKDLRMGAVLATLGLLILQTVGGYLITHHLKNLSGLYGQFAVVLALLFWIYLQAQVFVYSTEVNVVHTYKLWPRSLVQPPLTAADRKAYALYAEKEAYRPAPEEQIAVTFDDPQ